MKCPRCGEFLYQSDKLRYNNFIKRERYCRGCEFKTVTYEFLIEDTPNGFIATGTRVIIGDKTNALIPAVYLRSSSNSSYPYIAIDDEGELQSSILIPVVWKEES
jgi:hypothetical protein